MPAKKSAPKDEPVEDQSPLVEALAARAADDADVVPPAPNYLLRPTTDGFDLLCSAHEVDVTLARGLGRMEADLALAGADRHPDCGRWAV